MTCENDKSFGAILINVAFLFLDHTQKIFFQMEKNVPQSACFPDFEIFLVSRIIPCKNNYKLNKLQHQFVNVFVKNSKIGPRAPWKNDNKTVISKYIRIFIFHKY